MSFDRGFEIGHDSMRSGRMLSTPDRHLPSTAVVGRPMTDSTNTKKPSGIPRGRGSNQQESTTMTNTLSRRAILAGAACVPMLTIPAVAAIAPRQGIASDFATDPIFSAIEKHKATYLQWAADST